MGEKRCTSLEHIDADILDAGIDLLSNKSRRDLVDPAYA
jgi:hypothetical protein